MRVVAIAFVLSANTAQADAVFDRFSELDKSLWYVAEYDFSHPAFDTDWRASQVSAESGLNLSLAPHDGLNRFKGASIRTHQALHFGTYRSRLRAGKGEGVVTGFFTYTGPHYGTRHDEIDIEILGRDPTKLHVAWFVDGELTNHFVPLGFDASECIHDYAFSWSEDQIRWYVNDKLVFETNSSDGPLPTVPSHLFANIWAADPSIAVWSGTIDPDTQTNAFFEEVSFEPVNASETEDQNS